MSTSAEIRADAARIVAQVTAGRSLDTLLDDDGSLSVQERGLLRSLVYDSVRWYVRLDALLQRLLARPDQKIDPDIRALAIVGLCQLVYTDTPAHAAVAETVNAARVLGKPRAAGLLNALLRRFQREGLELAAAVDTDVALRTAHPRWLVASLKRDLPATFAAVLDANNARPPFWLRVNRLRGSGHAYRERLESKGFNVTSSLYDDEALMLERAVDVRELPGFVSGDVSVQDAAAQLAARLMSPAAGDRILDACAAPGGKTCHLLELQPRIAQLVAVDASAERLKRVQQNLERLALDAKLVAGDAETPERWWDGAPFDRILLDVPCSATGVIRRHPDIKLLRRQQDIPVLAARQRKLLESLWPLLSEGGRLVYASCSALRAENAAVIGAFLEQHQGARETTRARLRELAIDTPEDVGYPVGSPIGYPIAAGTAGMDGFYYACLEKTGRS